MNNQNIISHDIDSQKYIHTPMTENYINILHVVMFFNILLLIQSMFHLTNIQINILFTFFGVCDFISVFNILSILGKINTTTGVTTQTLQYLVLIFVLKNIASVIGLFFNCPSQWFSESLSNPMMLNQELYLLEQFIISYIILLVGFFKHPFFCSFGIYKFLCVRRNTNQSAIQGYENL